jgi:nitrite reductase/ring-hydroxylating ferredoxin subunit
LINESHFEEKRGGIMIRYVKVAEIAEFSEGRAKRVVIEDTEIVLFFIEGRYFAVQNVCPHQHFSALHEGILNGLELTCPMHGWTFDLSTGQATIGGGRLKCYSVQVDGDDVLVEAPDSDPDWAVR